MQSAVDAIKAYCQVLQRTLRASLQAYEIKPFHIDRWDKGTAGEGLTCVLEGGRVFERGGVNFSHILGERLPKAASAKHPHLPPGRFEAMGVSLVLHPANPYVPTAHLNVRFFITYGKEGTPIWWFGGGFDLTPYYLFEEDVVHWHGMAKKACLPFGDAIYPFYKAAADQYFYLPHRQEPRGVGGLFFDDLNSQAWGWDFDTCFAFMRTVGNHFWQAYGPLVERRYQLPFGERQRAFQLYRRGRYVEFNLMYDRGTLFGLQSGGRTESILMSMPPQVSWQYQWSPEADSPEAQLYNHYLKEKVCE